jgi:hypothetical protein
LSLRSLVDTYVSEESAIFIITADMQETAHTYKNLDV